MKVNQSKHSSVNMVRILMKTVGCWTSETPREEKILKLAFYYTIFAIGMALWIEVCDMYLSFGNLQNFTYTLCSAMPVLIILTKLLILFPNKKDMIAMVKFAEENFWFAECDEYGEKVLKEIDRKGIVLITCFFLSAQGTAVCYTINPILENIGKNESDRVLIFNIWLGDVPLNLSPYFEAVFVLQMVALFHSAICFVCFDNFLCLLNLHVTGQFKILRYKFETLFESEAPSKCDGENVVAHERIVTERFCKYVDQHLTLIRFADEVERIFTFTMLSQLLISSVMLCVTAYQVFLADGLLRRRMIFVCDMNGCFFQIFVLCYSAHVMMTESEILSDSLYNSHWHSVPHETYKRIKMCFPIVMIRSTKPCCITAAGFFPMNLETFMTILSTTVSYVTLLRKFLEEEEEE